MPRELRRRRAMENTELAPIADTRETEAEEIGPDLHTRGGEDDGVDDGFGPPSAHPTNGVPRHSPRPPGTYPPPVQPQPNPNPPNHGTGTATGTGKPGRRPMDVNLYATKKTMAQGMMDLALLTANANQLRYVLESGRYGVQGVNYYISLTLISISIILQLIIGVALIFLGRYNVSKEHHAQKADKLNNWVVVGVFVITVINVFISSFAIEPFQGFDPALVREAIESKFDPSHVKEKVVEGM